MKKKQWMAIGLSTLVAMTLVGCTSAEQPEKVVKDKVEPTTTVADEPTEVLDSTAVFTQVLEENSKLMEAENFEGYMDMLYLTDESRQANEDAVKTMFETFDIDVELSDVQVLNQTDTTAKVQVTQVSTERNESPDYTDNKTVIVHDLVLVDGEWKFSSAEIKSVDYLE